MRKNGFTLVELLGVIVILALVALVATPLIIVTIEKAEKEAATTSAYIYAKEVGRYIMLSELDPTLPKLQAGVEYKLNSESDEGADPSTIFINDLINIKGDKPTSGYLKLDNENKIEKIEMIMNSYPLECKNSDCKVTGSKVKVERLYKENILNGADPVTRGNLIAVNISSTGKVTKADKKQEWYSYENKKWANAVILFGEDTYNVGDTIEDSAIKQYYVWIPRYRYQLWNVNSEALYPNGTKGESAINIVFENKNTPISNGDENGEWLTHPAFIPFDSNGIWVGKFEISYNEETYTDNTKFLTSNPNYTAATTGTNIIIKPNVRSLTYKNVSELYNLGREVNSSLNSHMIKNTEWGAIAYLTYSNYGKCTNGTCEEVYTNNVNTGYLNEALSFAGQWRDGATITGCSGISTNIGVNSNNNACEVGYAWNQSNNKSSTTGNTSGIYDMSGGNYEYMMATIKDANGKPVIGENSARNSGFNGPFGKDAQNVLTTGIEFPTDPRYYDLYQYDYGIGVDIWYEYINGKLGDATREVALTKKNTTSGDKGLWYTDYSHYPSGFAPWFERGGGYNSFSGSGLMYFLRYYGHAITDYSTRVVLTY